MVKYIKIHDDGFQEDITHKMPCSIEELLKGEGILLGWSIDDIMFRNTFDDAGRKRKISKEDAIKILERIESNHDFCTGVNWDVVDCHINIYYQDLESEES